MGLAINASDTRRDGKPLPLGESITLGEATGADTTRFLIQEGLGTGLIAQLRMRALDLTDTELQKTSDYERFGKGSYEAWYTSKQRVVFALVEKKSGALAALAWFGPKPLGRKSMKHLSETERNEDERMLDAGNWHTIVYRSYAPFRGKGLMTDFMRFCMQTYQARYPGSKLWAGIYTANPASVGLARKLGFKAIEAAATDKNETIMVQE